MTSIDILAIAAHRDDVEQTCGGTLLRAAQRGQKTAILDLTRGEMGTRGTAEERANEAGEAAKILRVSWRGALDIADTQVNNTRENQLKIARVIRMLRPKVVVLPYWEARHPDHANASPLGYEACFLAGLRETRGLTYAGAINTDFIAARFPGDDMRPIYTGSIGKLLPCFYAVGRAAHAGEPFAGVDANLLLAALINEFDMNPAYCERVRGQTTPPPVTLRATDTKAHYNTQIPLGATLYLHMLTLERTPAEALEMLRAGTENALARALGRIAEAADA